jgi:hypothetical protein
MRIWNLNGTVNVSILFVGMLWNACWGKIAVVRKWRDVALHHLSQVCMYIYMYIYNTYIYNRK